MHQIPMFSKKIAYKNGLPWSASQIEKLKLIMVLENYQFQKILIKNLFGFIIFLSKQ